MEARGLLVRAASWTFSSPQYVGLVTISMAEAVAKLIHFPLQDFLSSETKSFL
jgi:hypothetical protein